MEMTEEMPDNQYIGLIADMYYRLMRLRKTAEKDNAEDTVKRIDTELEYIKIKLPTTELPE